MGHEVNEVLHILLENQSSHKISMFLRVKTPITKKTIQKTKQEQHVYYGQDSQSSSKSSSVFFIILESSFDSEVSDGFISGSSVFDVRVASRSGLSNSPFQLPPETKRSNVQSFLLFSRPSYLIDLLFVPL